jgi:hypothetical protein
MFNVAQRARWWELMLGALPEYATSDDVEYALPPTIS